MSKHTSDPTRYFPPLASSSFWNKSKKAGSVFVLNSSINIFWRSGLFRMIFPSFKQPTKPKTKSTLLCNCPLIKHETKVWVTEKIGPNSVYLPMCQSLNQQAYLLQLLPSRFFLPGCIFLPGNEQLSLTVRLFFHQLLVLGADPKLELEIECWFVCKVEN